MFEPGAKVQQEDGVAADEAKRPPAKPAEGKRRKWNTFERRAIAD
jgi:hypothetical protein